MVTDYNQQLRSFFLPYQSHDNIETNSFLAHVSIAINNVFIHVIYYYRLLWITPAHDNSYSVAGNHVVMVPMLRYSVCPNNAHRFFLWFADPQLAKWLIGFIVTVIENNICTRVTNCFSAHERVIWVFFSRVASKSTKNNTRLILFLTWHNKSINDDKNDDFYTSSQCLTRSVFVLLMTSQSIADDVTLTRQLWRDHVNNDI